MTIIEALQTWIGSFDLLAAEAPLFVDYVDAGTLTQYAIVPLPGPPIVERYLDGSSTRQYAFAIQFAAPTADDQARLANSGFMEFLSDEFERRTADGDLPDLGDRRTAEAVEAVNSGFLAQQGESDSAIYQISCRLEYFQPAMTSDESE
ncbi:MAG: hypothetical protein KF821_01885 [Anaerolineales bacterium]|nr:hypothetical protein [Anaerolineales bacterium]